MPNVLEFYVVNLRLVSAQKYFRIKKMKHIYTIRLFHLVDYVRMAGEDAENVEIKPGFRVGLILDESENVTKIILNNKDKYSNIRLVEVETIDLENKLFLKGYEEGEEDSLKSFSITS